MVRYTVLAVLLIAGLVVAYFALQEPKPTGAARAGVAEVQQRESPVVRF
jgi:hypothetical protein